MRVALVRQRYTAFGGAERFLAQALAALRERGVGVTLLTREWDRDADLDGIDVRELRPFAFDRTSRDRGFARAVQRVIAREAFDLVQSHERVAGCDLFRAGDGVHAAYLEQRARTLSWSGRLALRASRYHRFVLAAEREMFTHPGLRAVICNSRLVRDQIRERFDVPTERLHVIYNGVDTTAFTPRLRDEYRTPTRAQLGIENDATVYVFVGSGYTRKGLRFAIEALARATSATAHIVAVGRDRKGDQYRALATRHAVGDRVHIVGAQADVKPYLGTADAFILPTLYDPFPNAALEAMAAGLPVITSTSCGAADWIEDGKTGYVCDALDREALAAAMTKLTDRDHANELGKNARTLVAEFDFASMAQRYLDLYATLLPPKPLP